MPISSKANHLQQELTKWVNTNPVQVFRYLLLSGDGISSANSWQFADSWRAGEGEMARSQWYTQTNDGAAAKHIYFLIVPASAISNPTRVAVRQRLQLFDVATATSLGIFIINFVNPLIWDGSIFGYEIAAEQEQ